MGIDDIWRGYKMKKLKFINAIVGILISTTVLVGCAGSANEKVSDKSGVEAKTIVIGTGNAFKPYCY